MGAKSFTPDQDAQLRQEYEAGASPADLAVKWGAARNTVVAAIRRAGGYSRAYRPRPGGAHLSQEVKAEICRSYAEGEEIIDIAERLDVSCDAAWCTLRCQGVPIRRARQSYPSAGDGPAKLCRKCVVEKRRGDFARCRANSDGLQGWCRQCNSRFVAGWRKKTGSAYPRYLSSPRARESRRKSLLKQKYGLTPQQRQAILQGQGGGCAICRTTSPRGLWGEFCVDHCHRTGNIRGLLCNDCNRALELFKDDPGAVLAAAAYLEPSPWWIQRRPHCVQPLPVPPGESRRFARVRLVYGLTKEQYEAIFERQGCACAICRSTKPGRPGGKCEVFCLDHCHRTEMVRGILCNNCNRGIELFKDSPTLLRAAAGYLRPDSCAP